MRKLGIFLAILLSVSACSRPAQTPNPQPSTPTTPSPSASPSPSQQPVVQRTATVHTSVIKVVVVCDQGNTFAEPERIEYRYYPELSKPLVAVKRSTPNVALVSVFGSPDSAEHQIFGLCGTVRFTAPFTKLNDYAVRCKTYSDGVYTCVISTGKD